MPILPPPIEALTYQDLLDLLDELLPDHYLRPLKEADGYEVLQAYAALFSKISRAAYNAGVDAQISTADDGALATGQVELYRPLPIVGDVVVKAGTVVTTSQGGRDFVTLTDVTFLAASVGPFTVAVEAVVKGYEWNVPGQVMAADGTVLPGDIDTIKTLVEDPPLLDLSIKVRQIAPTTGGEDASLDSLGADRGTPRLAGESLDAYRNRIRQLPDTISPMAIYRTVLGILQPVFAPFSIIETFDIRYQTCWDGPSDAIPGSAYDPNLFCYDDARAGFRGRWMDMNDYRGGLIVVVDPIQPLLDLGMLWDDTALTPLQLVSPITGGLRSTCAYDVPSTFSITPQGAYDGLDYSLNSLYKSLYDTLQSTKPAGVSAAVELMGE